STTGSGSITLNAGISAGTATVTLNSVGTIAQNAGVITAATLTGGSVGGSAFPDANLVGSFSGFSNTGSGNVSLTNGQALSASNLTNTFGNIALTTTAGGLTLSGNVTLDGTNGTLTLASAGAIDQTGGAITTGIL